MRRVTHEAARTPGAENVELTPQVLTVMAESLGIRQLAATMSETSEA